MEKKVPGGSMAGRPGVALVLGRDADKLLNGELARLVASGGPDEVRAVVIDAGGTGAPDCSGSPHLATLQAGPAEAAAALAWLVDEAGRREGLLAKAGAVDLVEYNSRYPKDAMPFIGAFVYGWDNDAMSRKSSFTADCSRKSAPALLARLGGCGPCGIGVEVAVKWGRAADVLGARARATADLVVETVEGGAVAPYDGAPSAAAPLSADEAAAEVARAARGADAQGFSPAAAEAALEPYIDDAGSPAKPKPARRQLAFTLEERDYERFCKMADESGLSKVDYLLRVMRREEIRRGGERGMHELTVSIDGREVMTSFFRGSGDAAREAFGANRTVGAFFAALDNNGYMGSPVLPVNLVHAAFVDWRRACGYTEDDLPLAKLKDEADGWLANWGYTRGRTPAARPSELVEAGLLSEQMCDELAVPGSEAELCLERDEPAGYFRRGDARL